MHRLCFSYPFKPGLSLSRSYDWQSLHSTRDAFLFSVTLLSWPTFNKIGQVSFYVPLLVTYAAKLTVLRTHSFTWTLPSYQTQPEAQPRLPWTAKPVGHIRHTFPQPCKDGRPHSRWQTDDFHPTHIDWPINGTLIFSIPGTTCLIHRLSGSSSSGGLLCSCRKAPPWPQFQQTLSTNVVASLY